MKRLLPFLLFFSICAFAQSKDQAYQELGKLLKKVEGKSFIFYDGSGEKFKIHKQTLTPDKLTMTRENPSTGKMTNIFGALPWPEMTEIVVDTFDIKSKIISVDLNFKKEFPVQIIFDDKDGKESTVQTSSVGFDVYAEDVKRVKELVTILSK